MRTVKMYLAVLICSGALISLHFSAESAEESLLIGQYSGRQESMILFPGSLTPLPLNHSTIHRAAMPGSKAGWYVAGQGYRSGADWWALICDASEKHPDSQKKCQLVPTQLNTSRPRQSESIAGQAPGQSLYWSPLPARLNQVPAEGEQRPKLIALFQKGPALGLLKLKAGEVETYVHQGMSQYPSTHRQGTLEVRLSLKGGEIMDVIPRILNSSFDIATFELRKGNIRQQLPGYEFNETDSLEWSASKYLAWAGDLDGDGKPDFIFNHGDKRFSVACYLSSLAKKGELVGLAGRFDYREAIAPDEDGEKP